MIDLHIHTTASDGTDTPQEILEICKGQGIDVISFTDHDSVGAYTGLAQDPKVTIIKGVEISFVFDNEMKHMLGYGIDIAKMRAFLDTIHSPAQNIKRQQTSFDKFHKLLREKGLKIDDADEPHMKIKTGNTSEAFLHCYASVLKYPENVEKFPFLTVAGNTRFYWDYYQNPKSEYFVGQMDGLPDMQMALDQIHNAGGLAFLAHPLYYGNGRAEAKKLIDAAIGAGIDGIETQHSSNSGDDAQWLTKIAANHNLFVSGGSDYHGRIKPMINLGTGENNIAPTRDLIAPWFDTVAKV